jgi:hypothetical protein
MDPSGYNARFIKEIGDCEVRTKRRVTCSRAMRESNWEFTKWGCIIPDL